MQKINTSSGYSLKEKIHFLEQVVDFVGIFFLVEMIHQSNNSTNSFALIPVFQTRTELILNFKGNSGLFFNQRQQLRCSKYSENMFNFLHYLSLLEEQIMTTLLVLRHREIINRTLNIIDTLKQVTTKIQAPQKPLCSLPCTFFFFMIQEKKKPHLLIRME